MLLLVAQCTQDAQRTQDTVSAQDVQDSVSAQDAQDSSALVWVKREFTKIHEAPYKSVKALCHANIIAIAIAIAIAMDAMHVVAEYAMLLLHTLSFPLVVGSILCMLLLLHMW